jgi:hypothetical protein
MHDVHSCSSDGISRKLQRLARAAAALAQNPNRRRHGRSPDPDQRCPEEEDTRAADGAVAARRARLRADAYLNARTALGLN